MRTAYGHISVSLYYLSFSGHVYKTLLSKLCNLSKSVDIKALSTEKNILRYIYVKNEKLQYLYSSQLVFNNKHVVKCLSI